MQTKTISCMRCKLGGEDLLCPDCFDLEANLNIILKAKEFAYKYHEGDKYGDLPYTFHLNQVYVILLSFGIRNTDILATAWLHDVIEDTECTYEDVKLYFGETIADMVYLLTDKRGKNRAERHQKTYPALACDSTACCVKLADRIANWSFSQLENSSRGKNKFKMYFNEYEYFRKTLCSKDEKSETILRMWVALDNIYTEEHFCN